MTTIDIFGTVGDPDQGNTVELIEQALGDSPGAVHVRIKSGGGLAREGVAIYNVLKPYKPTVEVLSVAASAASLIAMAGRKVHLHTGAQMMVHPAWDGTLGDDEEHAASAGRLRKLTESIVEIYSERTGLSESEVMELVRAEGGRGTWLKGSEAVAAGFADTYGEPPRVMDSANAKRVDRARAMADGWARREKLRQLISTGATK